jgi:uncharacterized repeat protein (TIGR01451 family)
MSFLRGTASASSIALAIFLGLSPVGAKPLITVTLSQAMVITGADGGVHLTAPDTSAPVAHGAVIRYTVSAKDVGTDEARRLQLLGHIPAPTAFVPGSVHGPGGHAEFSLDGKTFSAQPMIAKTTPAGSSMVPADPSAYVMVRWTKDAPLEANSSAGFSYDVRVK